MTDTTTQAKPSREAVKGDREAAKEAKRLAKAAAVAKKAAAAEAGGGGTASTQRAAAPSTANTTAKQQQSKSSKPASQDSARPTSSAGAARNTSAAQQAAAAAAATPSAQQQAAAATAATPSNDTADASMTRLPSILGGVSLFGNVAVPKSSSTTALIAASHKAIIHPSVLTLALHLASFAIVGADARAIAVLRALRDMISDYRTPSGAVFSRDLVSKLGPQISHLVAARPLGASVGHAIRFLKYEISVTPVESGEAEARAHILSRIDHFIRDRITYASKVIHQHVAGSKIKDGDVILTFARSSVVEGALLEAWAKGRRFEVIVIDARPLCEGRRLLAVLLEAGIPCTYGLLTALSSLVPRATLVLLGTASLLANGALYARAGTAACAMMAHARGAPVIVCCETYKFSERIQLDGLVVNEAGDPTDLLSTPSAGAPAPALPVGAFDSFTQLSPTECRSAKRQNLGVVNLLYDLTPPRYITAVASEVGLSGPESVGVILRDYKSVLYGQ